MTGLRRTPLAALHERLGGRMVPFAGFEMPVQYSSIVEEHRAARETAALFDVSHMGQIALAGRHSVLASRPGYPGADGFELYCAARDAAPLFEALLAAGRAHGLLPAGLGARDTLRLEAALPLYGQELDADTTPLEAGLARFVEL